MKKNSIRFLFGLFFIGQAILAQPIDPPADGDPVAAPINQWMIAFFVIAIVYGFWTIKKQRLIYK
jgi:hypothetical protein